MTGEKILVVSTHVGLLQSIAEKVLSPYGFKPLLARGPDDGVREVLSEHPQLILLHLSLDSSLRLLRRLEQTGCLIPSILLVEEEAASMSVELLRLGVRDYVAHPYAARDILQAVHRVLGQGQASPERGPLQFEADMVAFNRELEERIREFDVLLGIGRSVSSLLDLDTVLNRVTEAAVFITGAEEGYLLLLDEESGALRLRAAQNLGDKQAQGFSLRVDDSIAGRVVSSGKPVLLSGDGGKNLKVKTGYLVKSLLNVPLKIGGRVIGVLGVDNQISNARFTLHHLRRLSALADMVATAIENARRYDALYAQFVRRVKEVATLQAVADQMNAVTDFDVAARLALSLALKATSAEAGVLAWAVGENGDPAFFVSQGSLGGQVLNQHRGAMPERWWDEQTVRQVIETGQPVLKGDLNPGENGHNPHARCRLVVPMRRGKRVVGAINLESSSPYAFKQEDLHFVLSVADQVAVALEGTVLYEKAEVEKARWALLMEVVEDAVWAVDTDLRLMMQNEAASKISGWSVTEAVGRPVYELQPSGQDSPYGLCHLLSRAMELRQRITFPEKGSPDGSGALLETKEGQTVWVRGRAEPVIQNAQVVGAICVFRQVPPARKDEYVRFEFANMASHLMRSPLSFIQASIDLMLNSELDVDEQRSMLEKMRDQSQRIREFIKELLEMSRLETGSVPIYLEPVTLLPLIDHVLSMIRSEEPRYVFSFSPPDTFPIVAADPGKVELILLSLLRNAMNRCPAGGNITLELEARSSEVIVSIADDGGPVPLKQLDRIFSQFYPVDDDGDKMPSTYQLGLYTTKRLVELQKGSVWAESQADHGMRFSFSLPIWG